MYWECLLFILISAFATFVGSMASGAFKEGGWFIGLVLMASTFFISAAGMMQLLHILKLTFKG